MPQPSTAATGPVLFITDLSARCDRALDRAVQLAQQNQVKLVVLHVIEPSFLSRLLLPSWNRAQKQHQQAAHQRILDDLQDAQVELEVLVEIGYPIDVIKATASQYNCSMIVAGTARDEALGRVMLGSIVERVARESTIPLLVVRKRPEQRYEKILVGTDFSESSRHALSRAASLIPHQSLTVFHSFADVAGVRQLDQATINEAAADFQRKAQAFIAATPAVAQKTNVDVVIQHGEPTQTIRNYSQSNAIDLVVLGTHGMSGILKTALGSVAEQLLLLLRCDVLIVPNKP